MRELHSIPPYLVACLASLMALGLTLGSCGQDSRGSFSDPEGPVLTWTPQNPLIGDLVELKALIPGDVWNRDKETLVLQDGDGKDVLPLLKSFHEKGMELTWRFRAKKPGIWTWGKDHRVLWSVPGAAKEGQGLVRFAGQDLWSLKADPSPLPQSAGPAQGGQAVLPPGGGSI